MATEDADNSTDNYRIKDIVFFGAPRRILLQSKNGPCPMLAICNVLLLRGVLKISPDTRYITFFEVVSLVSDWLFEANGKDSGGDSTSSRAANLRESLGTCLEILPKLNVGLDVNCRFGGVTDFEFTQEMTVFDLLDVALYHGWIVAKEDTRAYEAIGQLSYNQVVELIIASEEAQQKLGTKDAGEGDSGEKELEQVIEKGLIIKDFLDRTASQISYDGLCALHETVNERQLAVFFRNSHFNCMTKYEGKLYLLCTDIAFANSHLTWERFTEVDGDTEYCDADFLTSAEGGSGGLSAADAAAVAAADQAAAQVAACGDAPPEGDADAQLAWQMMQEDLRAEQEQVYAQMQARQAQAQVQAQAGAGAKAKAKAKVQPAPASSAAASTQVLAGGAGEKKKKSGKSCVLQ
eukprot:TRINITY_DN52870_c0_g1_i1.p1 TRINITY_DN52870_c0_g1~~TRINITY_DN52870_c0_g1_i1.p1  ORF type:complete len:407 (-),score=121.13 TRINITY_DN52870_c0_g1_i1:126-1346(-)